MIGIDRAIEANFHKVLEDHTAGDPMRLEVKWTNLSRRPISRRITELGTPFSRHVVSQLLRKNGYRRRKALKKNTMVPRHPDPNTQFENIARLKKKYLKAGLTVISMDTKKKELMGHFSRDGVIDTQGTTAMNDHDFASMGSGTVIPHGLYDVGLNQGFVHLNISALTRRFLLPKRGHCLIRMLPTTPNRSRYLVVSKSGLEGAGSAEPPREMKAGVSKEGRRSVSISARHSVTSFGEATRTRRAI